MKKSELSFKCMLGSPARNKKMYDAIIQAGIKNRISEEDFVKSAMCLRIDKRWGNDELLFIYAAKITEEYEEAPIPEVTFEAALEMLASVEPDAPEFDIKPFDRVLWKRKPTNKDNNDTVWHLDFYADRINMYNFACIGNGNADCIVPYTEKNAELNNGFAYPAGWWECENGKPVWRTK